MSLKKIVAAVVFTLIPATALAGAVTLKNKDGKETEILVKRSGSTTTTSIAGKATMELMGAPLVVTVKKTGSKIEAADGETVVISKGKLTKLTPPPEEGMDIAPTTTTDVAPVEATPAAVEATPEATPEVAPE